MLTIEVTTTQGTYTSDNDKAILKSQLLSLFEDVEDELVVINGEAVE